MSGWDNLNAEPFRHDLFRTLRELERAEPEKPRIGDNTVLAEEVVSLGQDPFAEGTDLVLMGIDTDDARGERAIVSQPQSLLKPLLTSRGDRVVVSTHPRHGNPTVHVVNFDGTGWRRFESGTALAVWPDPADGGDWVYLGTDHQGGNVSTVTRMRLDDPSRREVVARRWPAFHRSRR